MSAKFLPSCPTLFYPMNSRLLCPWDSPGKNTGVDCHPLLQEIFLTQGSKPHLLSFLHWEAGSLPLSTSWEVHNLRNTLLLKNANHHLSLLRVVIFLQQQHQRSLITKTNSVCSHLYVKPKKIKQMNNYNIAEADSQIQRENQWLPEQGKEWGRGQPTPVFLPGESHGGRSLVGYSPWGRKESDTTERLHSLRGKVSKGD